MSSIIFTLDFPRETVGTDQERARADKIRIDVMKGIISTLTGLDVIRQDCFVTFVGSDRKFIVTVHEARMLNSWLERAETLFRTGLLQGSFHWTGELGHDDPSEERVSLHGTWYIVPDKTDTHCIEFRCDSPMGKIRASTKWDGCTHLWIEDEYEHICDMDLYTDYLKSMRNLARDYFGGEFCVSGISEEDRLKKIAKLQEQEIV
jgi:hypothetical protein